MIKERPEVPQPECITYEQDGKVLKIQRRWFSLRYVPLAFFCIVWDVFLVFWYAMELGAEGLPWLVTLFPIVYIIIGLALTYFTVAVFINQTNLEVTAAEFKISHGPLPWFGQLILPTREITQFYTKHVPGNRTTFAYDLHVVTRDGKSRKVLRYLETPDIPLFIEQHIEKWLKIKDVPVAGEIERK